MPSPEISTLAHLHDQIAALFSGAEHDVQAGHTDLGPDIWLSTDPEGQARIEIHPAEGGGITVSLSEGDSGGWCCVGMRVPAETLAPARYAGILMALGTDMLVSYTPTLRYHLHAGGHQDVPVAEPVVTIGQDREILSYIPVDQGLLEQSRECEINLFFHNDAFMASLRKLEPLLIL